MVWRWAELVWACLTAHSCNERLAAKLAVVQVAEKASWRYDGEGRKSSKDIVRRRLRMKYMLVEQYNSINLTRRGYMYVRRKY